MRVKTSTSWVSVRLWRQTRRNALSWRKPCDVSNVSYVFFPQVCLWYIISLHCFTSWYSLQQEYISFPRWRPSPVVHSNFDYSTSTSNFWMIFETKIYIFWNSIILKALPWSSYHTDIVLLGWFLLCEFRGWMVPQPVADRRDDERQLLNKCHQRTLQTFPVNKCP